ncbi:MAG: MFS transporter [Gemmatimonadota bacterium]
MRESIETGPGRAPSEAADPEGRWRALGVLAASALLAMTTWFSATAVLPQLAGRWSLSASTGAWLTIAVQIGFVAGALVSASLTLADVLPPRRLLLFGAIGAAAANMLLLHAGGWGTAVLLRLATGFFLAGVYPPALKSMSTWFRRGRGVALGVLVGALTLGSAMPHLVNGLGGLDWHLVIVTTSALTVVGGALAELAGREGPFPFPRAEFDPRQAGRVFANRGVRLATLGYFGHMWELYAMWGWFAAFFGTVLARQGAGAGTGRWAAFAAFAVIGIGAAGCLAGGILGDRWGRTRTTAASMVVSGACALSIGWLVGASPWMVLAVGLVWGFAVVADSAQFSTMVTEVADQRYVGTALTLQLAIGFTLTVATLWLVPLVRDVAGWGWAFALLAPGPLAGVAAMLRLKAAPEARSIAGGRA